MYPDAVFVEKIWSYVKGRLHGELGDLEAIREGGAEQDADAARGAEGAAGCLLGRRAGGDAELRAAQRLPAVHHTRRQAASGPPATSPPTASAAICATSPAPSRSWLDRHLPETTEGK